MSHEAARPIPREPERGDLLKVVVRIARGEGVAGPYSSAILFERYARFSMPLWESFPPPPNQADVGAGQSFGYWFDKLLGELVDSGDLSCDESRGYWLTPHGDAQRPGLFSSDAHA
jgi:hypothetical protein